MKTTIFFAIVALMGCAAHGEDAKPARETYTNALLRVDASIKGLSHDLGNNTGELNAVKEELKALKAEVAEVAGEVAEVRKLLSLDDTEISIEVPKAPDPPTANASQLDAPLAEAADRRTVTFHGKPIDVADWLSTKLTKETRIGIGEKDTGNRAMVEQHLRYHGLEGDFSRYSREQLITLHSVAHLKDDVKPVKSKTVVRAVVPQATYGGGCANGQCQRPMTYYYSTRSKRR